jgi:hypothetical protein
MPVWQIIVRIFSELLLLPRGVAAGTIDANGPGTFEKCLDRFKPCLWMIRGRRH